MKKIIMLLVIIFIIAGGVWFGSKHISRDQVHTEEEASILEAFGNIQTENNENANSIVETRQRPIEVETIERKTPPQNQTEDTEENTQNENTVQRTDETEKAQTPPSSQTQEAENQLTILGTGVFNPDAQDSDSIHRGWGDISVVEQEGKRYVIFGDNFKVTPGPDFRLYIVPEHGVETAQRFKEIKSQSTQIAKVEQFNGKQIYTIPNSVTLNEETGIVIWCEAFSQFISTGNIVK